MRDFDFFSLIKNKKKASHKKIAITLISMLVIVFIIVVAYFSSEILIIGLKVNLNSMQKYLVSDNIVKKQNMLAEKKRKLDIMKKYSALVDEINNNIESANQFNSLLFKNLEKTLPQEAFFKKISMKDREINLDGITTNRQKVAEIMHNLDKLEIFEKINMIDIAKETEDSITFKFSIKCILKDVTEK